MKDSEAEKERLLAEARRAGRVVKCKPGYAWNWRLPGWEPPATMGELEPGYWGEKGKNNGKL